MSVNLKLKRLKPKRLFSRKSTNFTSDINLKSLYHIDSESDDCEKLGQAWTVETLKNNLSLLLQSLNTSKNIKTKLPSIDSDIEDLSHINLRELNQVFLWVTFLGRFDLMKYCYERGADISSVIEAENLNALHLAALNGSVEMYEWLIQNGCPVIQTIDGLTPMHYTVLGNQKELLQYMIQTDCNISSTVIHSAVFANSLECVKVLLALGIDVNTYHDSYTPLHIATDLRYINCMKHLLKVPSVNVNLKTETKGYTALHLAAENGYSDCIELLLDNGARIDDVNKKQQTALHLACQTNNLDCVEILLENRASINSTDCDMRTPLHAAVAGSQQSTATVELLIRWKANINIADRYGYTALHTAALNELEDCVCLLILNGANIVSETKTGISALNLITRKTPSSIPTIWKRLTQSLSYNSERNLKFSFREIINYSNVGEIGYLHTLIKEGHKEILKHPLLQAFLHLKWQKIRYFYFIRVFLVLLVALLLNLNVMTFVIPLQCPVFSEDQNITNEIFSKCELTNSRNDNQTAHNGFIKEFFVKCTEFDGKKNITRRGFFADFFDNPQTGWGYVMEIGIWSFLVIMATLNIIRQILCAVGYTSLKDYIHYKLNLTEVVLTILLFNMCLYTDYSNAENSTPLKCSRLKLTSTVTVFLTWSYLTFIIGQHPFFSTYIMMFKKVFKELLKLLAVYFCFFMGFVFTFSDVFSDDDLFYNPFKGFVRTLAMMTGELNLVEITKGLKSFQHEFAVFILLSLFIVLVPMALMNLLMGITVNDVEGLQKTAQISKLVHQTQVIYFLEMSLFHGVLPKKLRYIFRKFIFVAPDYYRMVVYVKPRNPEEKRLPNDIMMEALQLALNKNKSGQGQDDVNKSINDLEVKIAQIDKKITQMNDLIIAMASKSIETYAGKSA